MGQDTEYGPDGLWRRSGPDSVPYILHHISKLSSMDLKLVKATLVYSRTTARSYRMVYCGHWRGFPVHVTG